MYFLCTYVHLASVTYQHHDKPKYPPDAPLSLKKNRDPRIKTFPVIQGYLPGYGFS